MKELKNIKIRTTNKSVRVLPNQVAKALIMKAIDRAYFFEDDLVVTVRGKTHAIEGLSDDERDAICAYISKRREGIRKFLSLDETHKT